MVKDAAIAFMDSEIWDGIFAINTRGTMLMMKYTLPHMVKQGGGSIINTSSGASLRGDLFRPAYASSKEIGRASCGDRVCLYVSISVVAVSLKKKINTIRIIII